MRKRMGIVVVTLLGMLACSDGVRVVGDAMVDAGEALRDAGHEINDASSAMRSDAAAQVRTFEADCEAHTVRRTVDRASGAESSETKQYYAEVAVPGLNPATVTSATAVLCEREVFGVSPEPSYCDDYICENTPVDPLDCAIVAPQIEAGRARVYCGYRSENSAGILGESWHRARFVIE